MKIVPNEELFRQTFDELINGIVANLQGLRDTVPMDFVAQAFNDKTVLDQITKDSTYEELRPDEHGKITVVCLEALTSNIVNRLAQPLILAIAVNLRERPNVLPEFQAMIQGAKDNQPAFWWQDGEKSG
jgi:hypothetical protein